MGLIPDETISEIRSRADIVSVIGQHVQLKKAGRNWKGLCPFHGEKSPSFNVAADKGFFYCFGCHKKGDVFTFVMELQGKSFIEAAEALAEQCGVTIPETQSSPEHARARSERTQMLEVNRLAAQFFAEVLAGRAGDPGRAYLAKRGTAAAATASFQLGYAPGEWSTLVDFLRSRRADLDMAVKLGLIARRPNSPGYYDRFRDRLMCPIAQPGNEIAGFSGRLVVDAPKDSPAGAKYINSPESTVYKKSKLLFGLAQARDAMRIKGRAVLVEGNFDVVSMHQAGFTETVAPLGTALTSEQVDLLRRFANEVILFYDGDKAGYAATRSALEVLVAADVPVRIAWRPRGDAQKLEGQDPDSLLRSGLDVGQMLDRARDGIEHYAYEVWSAARGSSDARAKALDDIGRLVVKIANQTKREVITVAIAAAMDLDISMVRRAMGRPGSAAPSPSRPTESVAEPPPAPADAPFIAHELELVALLTDHQTLLSTPAAAEAPALLTDIRLRDMLAAAEAGASLAEIAPDRLTPDAVKVVLAGTYARHPAPDTVLDTKLRELHVVAKRRRITDLERQLAEAKKLGDTDRIRALALEVITSRR